LHKQNAVQKNKVIEHFLQITQFGDLGLGDRAKNLSRLRVLAGQPALSDII